MSGVADLSRFRPGEVQPAGPVGPPEVTWVGRILSLDQSIASTGWADLRFIEGGRILVLATGVIPTSPGAGSMEDTLDRGEKIMIMVSDLMAETKADIYVCEMPSKINPRAKSSNREAGPIAAMSVRAAARVAGVLLEMQNVQHVRNVLGLPKGADKKDTRAVVQGYIPGIDQRKDLRLNEHTYDAMAQAIATAIERSN